MSMGFRRRVYARSDASILAIFKARSARIDTHPQSKGATILYAFRATIRLVEITGSAGITMLRG